MSKKKLVKRVAGIALTVGVVILAIVCVGKVNRIQNEKDIIGTWKDVKCRGGIYLSRKWGTCCE